MKLTKSARSASSKNSYYKRSRMKEYLLLALIVFLSFATALAVFFLDATKDLRNRAAEDISLVCNRTCTENRECLSNMVCWPYNRPSDQKGTCRLDSNPNNEQCKERTGIGFIVQVYEDKDVSGRRDNNEQGQSWDFVWDKNGDENWRPYTTYTEKNGEGGRVGELQAGDRIRVRVKEKGGWELTTPTEIALVMATETTKVAYFGVRIPPKVVKTVAPVVITTAVKKIASPTPVSSPALGAKMSPTPSPSMMPSPSPVVVAQVQENLGFLGWLRLFFRKIYCSVSKSCTAL